MRTVEQRLLARTKEDLETGCWVCGYAKDKPGINIEGSTKSATRVAFQLWKHISNRGVK